MDRIVKLSMVVAVLLLGVIAAYVAELAIKSKSGSMHPTNPDPQRYQVVNGTPELARNIMLLDTQSGNTWIFCKSPEGESGWCRMFMSSELTTNLPQKKQLPSSTGINDPFDQPAPPSAKGASVPGGGDNLPPSKSASTPVKREGPWEKYNSQPDNSVRK